MAIAFTAAANAYGSAAKLITEAGKVDRVASTTGRQTPDFASLLSSSLNQVVETGKVSDKMSVDMVNGRANVVDMVTAVSQTELAVETLVTVRDRVISAYEEIMRMPI